MTKCVCIPILVTTFPEWLSGTEPLPHTTVVFVVFCVHMYSFVGVIRRTPPPTFSDTAITNRHSDTTISSSELTGYGYPGLLDRKNRLDMFPRWELNPRLPACKASTLSTRPGSPFLFDEVLKKILYRQKRGSLNFLHLSLKISGQKTF